MDTYPREIHLVDSKIEKLLKEKSEEILKGRAESEKIEVLEKELADIEAQIVEAETAVDTSELDTQAQALTEEMNATFAKMEALKQELLKKLQAEVPPSLKESYDSKKQEKETAELQRNKYALKAQKYTDKIIPLARKLMSPHLKGKYEDYGGIELSDNGLKVTIFSHLDDWEQKFNKRT